MCRQCIHKDRIVTSLACLCEVPYEQITGNMAIIRAMCQSALRQDLLGVMDMQGWKRLLCFVVYNTLTDPTERALCSRSFSRTNKCFNFDICLHFWKTNRKETLTWWLILPWSLGKSLWERWCSEFEVQTDGDHPKKCHNTWNFTFFLPNEQVPDKLPEFREHDIFILLAVTCREVETYI